MKVYVKWPDTELYRGPYEASDSDDAHYLVSCVWKGFESYVRVFRKAAFPLTDGWQAWTGVGESPKGGVEVLYRNGMTETATSLSLNWALDSHFEPIVIAYRIVEEEELPVPLSTIMNRSLWWLDDTNVWRAVDSWDTEAGEKQFRLTEPGYDTYVSRDWFTGRRHGTAKEIAE